jgi:hypothetical protein
MLTPKNLAKHLTNHLNSSNVQSKKRVNTERQKEKKTSTRMGGVWKQHKIDSREAKKEKGKRRKKEKKHLSPLGLPHDRLSLGRKKRDKTWV